MKTQREKWEEIEDRILGPGACRSRDSRGRSHAEPPCAIRTDFQRDRDRIVHSKAFRRLKHKTQVFISPRGDHFRTRLTHTLEVAQVSRTIARALQLNEDLVEAVALGHDLGHTPFGHSGELVLADLCPGGFRHNLQSLRVVDTLENGGAGLNLTWEVRDAILHHTGPGMPQTREGQLVRVADRIAYINHDIDDALRAGILQPGDLPRAAVAVLGPDHRQRIDTMVRDMIDASAGDRPIGFGDAVGAAATEMRSFLFDRVYLGPDAKTEEEKVERLLAALYGYFLERPGEMPDESCLPGEPVERKVTDYIAGMTDSYATALYARLFVPRGYHPGTL